MQRAFILVCVKVIKLCEDFLELRSQNSATCSNHCSNDTHRDHIACKFMPVSQILKLLIGLLYFIAHETTAYSWTRRSTTIMVPMTQCMMGVSVWRCTFVLYHIVYILYILRQTHPHIQSSHMRYSTNMLYLNLTLRCVNVSSKTLNWQTVWMLMIFFVFNTNSPLGYNPMGYGDGYGVVPSPAD